MSSTIVGVACMTTGTRFLHNHRDTLVVTGRSHGWQ